MNALMKSRVLVVEDEAAQMELLAYNLESEGFEVSRAVDGEEARADSSGLGLAIVKRILDLHDSRISVVSEGGAGTRFEFELPIRQQAA